MKAKSAVTLQPRLRVRVGQDIALGPGKVELLELETFEALFATNHKFYGPDDLWGLRNIPSVASSIDFLFSHGVRFET